MRFAKARKISFLLLAGFLIMFLFSSLEFTPARATALINHTCQGAAKAASVETCALTISATGDLVVVVVTVFEDSASCPPLLSTNSTGGSETYSFVGNTGCIQSNGVGERIWISRYITASSSSHTISVTLVGPTDTNGYLSITGYDTSGSVNSVVGTTTGTGTTASGFTGTLQASPSLSYGASSVLIAGIITGLSSTSAGAGTGFTSIQTALSACDFSFNEYSTDANVNSPTTFPWAVSSSCSVANALWLELGAVIGVNGPGGGCSSVTSCNSTQVVTLGNVEVIAIQWSNQLNVINSVTDSLGNSWKAQTSSLSCDSSGCINGHVVQTSIWDSLITTGGTSTITVTMSASTTNIGLVFYSVANVNPTPTCIAGWSTTTGVTSTVIATSTVCQSLSTNTDIASIAGLGSFALSAGANYVLTQAQITNFGAETGNINGNTVFPASIASATVVSEAAIVLGPVAQGGNLVLGSCPTKNTATNALTNSTVYFWTGTALANEQVNTLQTEIASVNSGHVASETLALAVYATPSAGAVSVNNPLTLVGNSFKFFVLTPTASPQSLLWAANINLGTNGILAGATVAIAIQGNSKILINSSSLSGMQTASGTIGAGNQFTALSATATQLFFCGQLSYQVVVTTTTTISTTTSIISTITTTINQAGVVTNTNAYFALLIIVGLFLIMAKVAGLPGAMLGAIIGIIVVILAGFLTGPPAYIAIVLVGIGSLAVIVSRLSNSGNAGGGM